MAEQKLLLSRAYLETGIVHTSLQNLCTLALVLSTAGSKRTEAVVGHASPTGVGCGIGIRMQQVPGVHHTRLFPAPYPTQVLKNKRKEGVERGPGKGVASPNAPAGIGAGTIAMVVEQENRSPSPVGVTFLTPGVAHAHQPFTLFAPPELPRQREPPSPGPARSRLGQALPGEACRAPEKRPPRSGSSW